MSDYKHIIGFKGSGLNSDDSEEGFAIGDSKARRNVMRPENNSDYLEPVFGNTLKAHGLGSHSGTIDEGLLTLGYGTDTENDKLYYIVQGKVDGGDNLNSIIEFDPLTEAFAKVIWDDAALECEEDKIIKGIEIVDGWIYYNGYENGLKKVNITFAKNYTNYDAWVSGASYSIGDDVRV